MNKNSTSQSAFTLRLLVASVFCAASVVITLLGFGTFSAEAQLRQRIIMQSTDPLVPVGFDCSRISELGIDKQENLRAGAIMIACGEAPGGRHSLPLTRKTPTRSLSPTTTHEAATSAPSTSPGHRPRLTAAPPLPGSPSPAVKVLSPTRWATRLFCSTGQLTLG